MITGIGIDIVEFERIDRIHARYGDRFAERILCEREMAEYMCSSMRSRLLAKRFAAKEAAVKALGTGFALGITPRMICIRHDDHGRPELELTAAARQAARSMGHARSWLSISDERNYSVAVVVLESAGG